MEIKEEFQTLWKLWTTPQVHSEWDAHGEYATRVVFALMGLTLAAASMCIVLGWAAGLFDEGLTLVITAGLDISIFLGWGLVLRGSWRQVRGLPVLVFLALGVYFSYRAGFDSGSAGLMYVLAILLAGIVLGERESWITLGITLLLHMGISLARFSYPTTDILAVLITFSGALVGADLLETFYLRYLRTSLAEARRLSHFSQEQTRRRSQAEQDVKEKQQYLVTLSDLPLAVWGLDKAGRIRLAEGKGLEAIGLLPGHDRLELHDSSGELVRVKRAIEASLAGKETSLLLNRSERYYDARFIPMKNDGGVIVGSMGAAMDITERVQAEQALRENQERLRQVVMNMPVMLDAFDRNNRIIVWNRECERVTGYCAEEILSHPEPLKLLYPDESRRLNMLKQLQIAGNFFRGMEWTLTCKDGTHKIVSWSNISREFPIPGWDTWAVGVDITLRKEIEEELRYLSAHDTLTGLYNRTFFESEMARLFKSRMNPVSVVVIDVDGLKRANDLYGHAAGDELLKATAQVVQSAFRGEDIVARIGGDEFAILLPYTDSQSGIEAVDRLQSKIIENNTRANCVPVFLSIGAATTNPDLNLAEAFRLADSMMYEDKQRRKERK